MTMDTINLPPRIQILTSCTGEKIHSPTFQLRQADLAHINEPDVFSLLEERLSNFSTIAQDLYSGQQHVRLMRGVDFFRSRFGQESIKLSIVSAGYGVIEGEQRIVPYECTFQGMKTRELHEWAEHLRIPRGARAFFSADADLTLVLLGEAYLRALSLDEDVEITSPTIFFTSENARRYVKGRGNLRVVTLTSTEARRFSCALVGLKGELARRLMIKLASSNGEIETLMDSSTNLLDALAEPGSAESVSPGKRVKSFSNTAHVIHLPDSWRQKPHRRQLTYFMPDWDDLVDPGYDFETDTHSGGTGNWENQVYAHQLYSEPNYDGLLVSKAVAEQSKKKRERIHEIGVHNYLRVPSEFPIMGDCGAFSYVSEDVPPYSTAQIVDYYTQLGFDFGVSVDHLLFGASSPEGERERYELTIHNAEEFLVEHRRRSLSWTPIGAIQGWDASSFAEAARQYVAMGYKYLGLGGLVKTNNEQIFTIARAVREVIPAEVKVHLFGVARPEAVRTLVQLGISSADSASPLRQAWMREREGYLTELGPYAAIRIPDISQSSRARKSLIEQGIDMEAGERLEDAALNAIRAYARHETNLKNCLDALLEYETIIAPGKKDMRDLYGSTLEDRPWERCDCAICRQVGVEVVMFRGNNRNRRRGFHNTYVYYRVVQKILAGEPVHPNWAAKNGTNYQLSLPVTPSKDHEM